MKQLRRITAPLAVVLAITLLTSCSPDGSGSINGPGDSLDRKEGITKGPELIQTCKITPNNIFMDDDALPFTAECEDMSEAIHVVRTESANGNGCTVERRGTVMFPSNGHTYSYVAVRNRCTFANASMTVCGTMLEDCVTFSLPVPTEIDVRDIPSPAK
ncbi:MAG: hypothetical protein Kow0074_02810 [Candidatus Zixiibacteriota bacterium]